MKPVVMDNGVAIPPRPEANNLKIERKWPLREMKVGESFFAPVSLFDEEFANTKRKDGVTQVQLLYLSLCGCAKTTAARQPLGRSFEVRILPDASGCRLWRTA